MVAFAVVAVAVVVIVAAAAAVLVERLVVDVWSSLRLSSSPSSVVLLLLLAERFRLAPPRPSKGGNDGKVKDEGGGVVSSTLDILVFVSPSIIGSDAYYAMLDEQVGSKHI